MRHSYTWYFRADRFQRLLREPGETCTSSDIVRLFKCHDRTIRYWLKNKRFRETVAFPEKRNDDPESDAIVWRFDKRALISWLTSTKKVTHKLPTIPQEHIEKR